MSDNRIRELPASLFDAQGELSILDLSDNNLTSFPTGVFNSSQLSTLDLSDNHILSLAAGVFDSLGGLKYLDLGDNHILSLPGRCV